MTNEPRQWRVRARADIIGVAYVEAESMSEALKLAADLTDEDFNWCEIASDHKVRSIEVTSIEPAPL